MKMTYSQVKAMADAAKNNKEFLSELSKQRFLDDGDEQLGNLASEVLDKMGTLETNTDRLMRVSERVKERLTEKYDFSTYSGISSHGELQAMGPMFDVACALYTEAHSRLFREVTRRLFEEEQKLRDQILENLSYVEKSVVSALRHGARTLNQISNFTQMPHRVEKALKSLYDKGIVTIQGRYYHYEENFKANPEILNQLLIGKHQPHDGACDLGNPVCKAYMDSQTVNQ